ncbi:MAG: hypothetical protein PUH54_10470 [Oscillospiraceae bacterium]|nr:hypothetical protein [Oscillospiraceae bacterium]
MENKKGFSVLKFLITVICIIFIALSLAVNIMFNQKHSPNIFGYYIYLLNNQDMGNLLPQGTALISKEADGLEIKQGDIILCHLNESDEVIIRTVYKTVADESTGSEIYYLSTANAQDDNSVTDFIPRENILALCTGYPQNINLGRWINFTLNIKGIIIQLILPSIILVIFLIAKIASSKDDEDDEEDNIPEEKHSKPNPAPTFKASDIKETPLFVDPTPQDYTTDELERKKQSIAEHFSHKEVNPNSPYQKEKERTMQFKALREAENTAKLEAQKKNQVDVTEMFSAPKNISHEKTPADTLREEMQKHSAETEKPAVTKTAPKPVAPRKSSTPDIGDIIKKSENNAKKKNVSNMSVDDLLKLIEDEKNKL